MPLQRLKGIFLRYGIWILIAAYVVFFSFLTAAQFDHFLFHDFDLAVHVQTVWNILHGTTFNSILGISFLGNHANFISFFLAPFYAVFPTPVTLLVLQTAALGFSAYPLFLIARKYLSEKESLGISVLYLIYPGIIYTNLFEFHPTPFATFFLAWMLYHFVSGSFGKFILYAFLGMLCQENISLIVLMMGFLALIEKRSWKWALCPFSAGMIYFLICAKWMLPHFADGKVNFFLLYDHLGKGLFDVLGNMLADPGKVAGIMLAPDRLIYLLMLFAPLCLIPLLGLRALLPILPIFLQHMLSNRLTERSLEFHYTAEMLPFIFLALIFALRSLRPSRKLLHGIMAMIFICAILSFIQGPYQKITEVWTALKDPYPASVKEDLLKSVPPQASLVTTFDFMPKTSRREALYSFHHIYWGHYTLSEKDYQLPASLDYALLDMMDTMTFGSFYTPDGYLRIKRFLDALHMAPVAVRDNFVLFARDPKEKIELFSSSSLMALREGPALFSDGEVRLDKVDALINGNVLNLVFDWQALAKPGKDIGLYVDFLDQQGKFIRRLPLAVCYRIYPTQAWSRAKRVIDRKFLTVPEKLEGHDFSIRIGFFDQVTRRILGKEIVVPVNKGD